MREKKDSLVITFVSATAAMAADRFFTGCRLPGRLIPVPREITAGCGMAWKADPDDREILLDALAGAGLAYDAAYRLLI